MSEPRLVDVTGRLRSPAATPGHWAGCAPPNKGQRYAADPPTIEEIILVMRQAGAGPYADRTRGLIAILWRAGLRISEALALTETDLDARSSTRSTTADRQSSRRAPACGHSEDQRGTCSARPRAPLLSPDSRSATVPQESATHCPEAATSDKSVGVATIAAWACSSERATEVAPACRAKR